MGPHRDGEKYLTPWESFFKVFTYEQTSKSFNLSLEKYRACSGVCIFGCKVVPTYTHMTLRHADFSHGCDRFIIPSLKHSKAFQCTCFSRVLDTFSFYELFDPSAANIPSYIRLSLLFCHSPKPHS